MGLRKPARIRIQSCSREQALYGSGLPEAADTYDPLYSHGDTWRARDTQTGVTTIGSTKFEALHRLADALREYEDHEGRVEMGEHWWIVDF